MKPGIYPDLPAEEYHAAEGVGSSRLRRILRSAAHLKKAPAKPSTPDQEQGTLIHTAVLEPEHFENRVVVCSTRRGTKAWKEAEETAVEKGAVVAKPDMVETALAVRDAVHAKPEINRIITAPGAMIEHSAFAVEPNTDVLCKVRPDLVSAVMIDVKSTRDASWAGFSKSIGQYRYHFQAAMYLDIWRHAATKEVCPDVFMFLALEKEPPYESALYELDTPSYIEGEIQYRSALEQYALCLEQDAWPGYPDGVTKLSLPAWAFEQTRPTEVFGPLGFPLI